MTDIVIVIACSLCGFALGKYLEKRIRDKSSFYADLNRYISQFKVNIDGRQVELQTFNAVFCQSCGTTFGEYLMGNKLKCRLSNTERKTVKDFFDNISAVSSDELKRHLEYYSDIFAAESKRISEEAVKSSIYAKLGILLGVMAGIILV